MYKVQNLFIKLFKAKFAICYLLFAICVCGNAANAAVAQRTPAKNPSARPSTAAVAAPRVAVAAPVVTETVTEEEPVANTEPEIENKSSDFSTIFSEASSSDDSAAAARIRQQREAISAAESQALAGQEIKSMQKDGGNACDTGLRKCMGEKCGDDFSKCKTDSAALWGTKIDACGRDAKCDQHDFALFAPELKADRDHNVILAGYKETIRCGEDYNACILRQCGGKGFTKCIGKAGGDTAIASCKADFEKCREADNGLQSRAMELFASLRVDSEKLLLQWEQELRDLRAQMKKNCERIGGLFDERSLGCVFTVEFWTNQNSEKPMATRIIKAGGQYTCSPEWFGVNVGEYLQNAARYEAAQQSAVGAFTGATAGAAAGAWVSGAPQRAIASQKAGKELRQECNSQNMIIKKNKCEACPPGTTFTTGFSMKTMGQVGKCCKDKNDDKNCDEGESDEENEKKGKSNNNEEKSNEPKLTREEKKRSQTGGSHRKTRKER